MKSISFVVSQYLVDVWGEDLPIMHEEQVKK